MGNFSTKDEVSIRDSLELSPITTVKRVFDEDPREAVEIKGFFSIKMRERGKIVPGSSREGFNIWTLSGREYLAQLMSISVFNPEAYHREDHIFYVGFGTGTTPEVAAVTQLVTPVAYVGTTFMAQLDLPTFPLSPSRTSVKYSRTFATTELSISGSVELSEAGLFTDGDPASNHARGTRLTSLAQAPNQPPQAYKSFDPIKKTQNFELELNWEIRF